MNFRPDTMLSKLILLFVFDKLEIAITENTIMEICWSRNNRLNYMEIVDIIPSLMEMNFLIKTKDADMEERYYITQLGRDCLTHFHHQIPENLRNEISEFCKEHRMDLKRSQEYVCNFVKTNEDNYTEFVISRSKDFSKTKEYLGKNNIIIYKSILVSVRV